MKKPPNAYTIEMADISDIDYIYATMREVSTYTDPDLYVYPSMDSLRRRFANHTGFVLIARDAREASIAAVLTVLIPKLDKSNLGWELGMSEAELMSVAEIENTAVRKEHRGNGLQRRMGAMAESIISDKGLSPILCSIHPKNKYSLQNAIAGGYTVVKRCKLYGGKDRLILRKEMLCQ